MEEIIKQLKSYGTKILSTPYEINNYTLPLKCSSDVFLKACESAIQSNDTTELITGICFSFGSYVSYNFDQIDADIFWEILIRLSTCITNFPIIYGYLEAVTELSIRSRKVDDKYLFFLSDPEQKVPNETLKPLILTALLDYLPKTFIFKETEYFLPLVLNSFKINDFLYRSNFLLLLTKMNLNMEIISSLSDFSTIVWDFIYETSLSDTNFVVLTSPLEKLRDLVPDFFEVPNEIISQALQSITDENIFGLVRLLPYLNFDDFQNVLEAIFDFVSTNTFISPKFNDAVFDSLNSSFNEQAIEYIFSILSKNLLKNFDDVSIYIYSLYFNIFEDIPNDPGLFLIKSINLAFSSPSSNKSILCFAIYQIVEQYKTRSKLLRNSVIPSLISTFTLNDDVCSKYASKAIVKMHQTQTVRPSIFLEDYLQLFDELVTNIPEYSIYCIKKYFKVLHAIVDDRNDDNDTKDDYDETLILQFVEKYILDEQLPLEIKAFILELCTSLVKSFPNKFDPLKEIASSLTLNLLKSDIPYSYPIAAEFILFYNNILIDEEEEEKLDFPEIESAYNRLIEISEGKVTDEAKFSRITSYYTAIISSQSKGLKYPIEIISQQFSPQTEFVSLDEELKFKSRAITNLQFVFSQYNDENLNELLSAIIQTSKVIQSSVVVDSTFLLLKKLIKQKPEFSFQFALDLILSTFQGRINLLDHNFPFNYDNRKFKFYKCLSSLIKHYKDEKLDSDSLIYIIIELIDWAPLASEDILPQIIKSLNQALEVSAIPTNKILILWKTLIERLMEDWRNTDLANYLLGCLVNMLVDYPNICDSKDLMEQLEYMWEEKDDEMVLILPPIFLDIWSNTNADIKFSLFDVFTDFTINEKCSDWSYPLILNYYIKIANKEEELDRDIIFDVAWALANFILMDDEKRKKLEFDEEMVDIMKKCLTTCYLKYNEIRRPLLDKYRKYPKKIDTLSQIFDTDLSIEQ